MNKTALSIFNQTKKLRKKYDQNVINGQQVIQAVHNLKKVGLTIHMNIDNYLYVNGLLNRKSAIKLINKNLNKFKDFPSHKKLFTEELTAVKKSSQNWFENYGEHEGLHDLVKTSLDKWKIDTFLYSLLCELYIGSYDEHHVEDMMAE